MDPSMMLKIKIYNRNIDIPDKMRCFSTSNDLPILIFYKEIVWKCIGNKEIPVSRASQPLKPFFLAYANFLGVSTSISILVLVKTRKRSYCNNPIIRLGYL